MPDNHPSSRGTLEDRLLNIRRRHYIEHRRAGHAGHVRKDGESQRCDRQCKRLDNIKKVASCQVSIVGHRRQPS